jgi:signal transduction histidine kinase/CheY-like chemotaxis protein
VNRVLVTVSVRSEHDVVTARQRARRVAQMLGFDNQDCTRVSTVVSEIARNAVVYAGGGRVAFGLEGSTAPQVLVVQVSDTGPGIRDVDAVLEGRYVSSTGMGLGLLGARRLMDRCDVRTSPNGTIVTMHRILPRHAPYLGADEQNALLTAIERDLRERPASVLDELQQQNRELGDTLDELTRRQDELTRLNAELADTNRGVLALYAELDEKADHLRRADELKTRFLSNMSHEFRTPLGSILALVRLLEDRTDGPLTPEQERQIGFIRSSASDLLELVNDLLDLARVEAGKDVVRPTEFVIDDLFGALRGMLRPLLVSPFVQLEFDDARDVPSLTTDEGKVSQIVRNLLSNAIKFTERGRIRVSARKVPAGTPWPDGGRRAVDAVAIVVSDTGVGIAPADRETIFEEFKQAENALQTRVKGTGLGLPLCRKLATMLGGTVTVESELGRGSAFTLVVPRRYERVEAEDPVPAPPRAEPIAGAPVLVIEDRAADRMVVMTHLRDSGYRPVFAERILDARALLASAEPAAIVLDILLPGEDSWRFLAEIKAAASIPVIVTTTVDDPRKGLALGADAYGLKPIERQWLLDELHRLVLRPRLRRVLVVDDEATSRYLMRSLLESAHTVFDETATVSGAIELLDQEAYDLAIVDLRMPDRSGMEVLRHLARDRERRVPAVLCTGSVPTSAEQRELNALGVPVVTKSERTPALLMRRILEVCFAGPAGAAFEPGGVAAAETRR